LVNACRNLPLDADEVHGVPRITNSLVNTTFGNATEGVPDRFVPPKGAVYWANRLYWVAQ